MAYPLCHVNVWQPLHHSSKGLAAFTARGLGNDVQCFRQHATLVEALSLYKPDDVTVKHEAHLHTPHA